MSTEPKVKKAYAEVVEFLQANADKKVSTILNDVIALVAAKSGSGGGKATTFHRNDAGEVVAIRCYYHGLWMDPRVVEFGTKQSSPTGLNNMCKDGVSKWTKQERDSKNASMALLDRVQSGELAPEDIADEQAKIAEEKAAVIPREDGYGFATLEECLADSEARGLAV